LIKGPSKTLIEANDGLLYLQKKSYTSPETIRCPLCEYELRGLIDPLCPECGYRFEWPDLLDPSRRKHPYLFELYPKRNAWSFFKTAFHSLPVFIYRLIVAYWRYLKFRHVIGTVLLTQFIVALILVIAIFYTGFALHL